ncbi:MAG TPA: diacylglycerol kinase family protein [Caulobacteraceae bacterium]|nr:diacylglycerol kinase family protein [Caulobacteraceae bacterium]
MLAGFGLDHEVSELAPGRFEQTVRTAVEARPDLIVVLGGDGTARLVAETCGPQGPLLAPLSGGTMNKLGRVIYGSQPWPDALTDALLNGAPRWTPGGEIDGRAFYCRAVLGAPALLAQAREAVREHRFGRATRRAVAASRKARHTRLGYDIGGERGRALSVGLICPTVSRALDENEGALEAAIIDLPSAKAGVSMALNTLTGEWRDDPHVQVRPCETARIWSTEPIQVMLDGEFFELGRDVQAHFNPHAFRALSAGRRSRRRRRHADQSGRPKNST